MKSYTDLNQSKKLTEILPIESADMGYAGDDEESIYCGFGDVEQELYTDYGDGHPCWSLAALFAALQNHCGILETRLRTNKKYNVFAAIGGFVYNSFEEHPDGIDIIDGLYELTLMLNKEKLL